MFSQTELAGRVLHRDLEDVETLLVAGWSPGSRPQSAVLTGGLHLLLLVDLDGDPQCAGPAEDQQSDVCGGGQSVERLSVTSTLTCRDIVFSPAPSLLGSNWLRASEW